MLWPQVGVPWLLKGNGLKKHNHSPSEDFTLLNIHRGAVLAVGMEREVSREEGGSETAEIGQSPLEPTPFLDCTVWQVSLGTGDVVAGILRARPILVRDALKVLFVLLSGKIVI